MERLKTIKEQLVAQVESQMGDLKCVDTHELGAVIDMIKDLAKAMYYCEVTEQMTKAEEQSEMRSSNNYYYTEHYYPMRDMDKHYGRMYYPDSFQGSEHRNYTERDYPLSVRDEREGRSPIKRKMYMESKDTHQDSSKSLKELESYMQDLTSDMMEMLEKASPEEKAVLQKKVNTLAAKVQNV